MNVGILTFHFSDNYGAALQAYALRRWFAEQGHQVQFIDYRPAHIEHGGRLSLPTSPAKFKANLKVVYLAASAFINEHFGNPGQRDKFVRFRRDLLGVADDQAPTDNDAALARASTFDLLVAGSDQIWSPSQHFGFDPNYFFAFAHTFPGRRISYAASFGRDRLSQAEAAQLPGLLSNFDAVGVREASGVQLVEQATGQKPVNVPDPTLLLSDYSALTTSHEPTVKEPYVFCYALRSPDNIRPTAQLVAKSLKAPILSPHNPHRRWLEIGTTVHPDPAEWVSLLQKARFVVTNSFHGTVFSLMFKKPFIVAGLTGDKATANARAINLLRAVGLEDRITSAFSASQVQALMQQEIDWTVVHARLQTLREAGVGYLREQIGKVRA